MAEAVSEMKQWMLAVKARDQKCVRCGTTEDLQVHRVRESGLVHPVEHIDTSWLFSLENGVTLCPTCAKNRHNTTHGD